MPVVSIDLAQFSGEDPGLEPDDGSIWFWPYRPYVEDDALVSREILKVRTEDGAAAPVIPETPVGEAVWVQLRGVKGAGTPWLILVPATDVNLFDLAHIDPDTLDPEAPADPAWLAAWAALVADVADLTDALADETTARENADTAINAELDGRLSDASIATTITAQVGVSFAGPVLPDYAPGTHYVWTKTDAVTGDLIDIITGVAS